MLAGLPFPNTRLIFALHRTLDGSIPFGYIGPCNTLNGPLMGPVYAYIAS